VIVAKYRDDEQNPFAAPASDLAPEAFRDPIGKFVYADFGTRFVAAFIDGLIVQATVFIVSLAANFAVIASAGNGPDGAGALFALQIVLQIGGQLFAWLYSALQESSDAMATVGKRAMGIRVVDLSGEKISFGRATGRYFGKIISTLILLIGFLMQPFTQRKQALHDILAGCLVVKG
jgi:uncharacterized RDD family membrane protein YckC